jgi:hypothetical protein
VAALKNQMSVALTTHVVSSETAASAWLDLDQRRFGVPVG